MSQTERIRDRVMRVAQLSGDKDRIAAAEMYSMNIDLYDNSNGNIWDFIEWHNEQLRLYFIAMGEQ